MPEFRVTLTVLTILEALLSDPSREWFGLELAESAGIGSTTIYAALSRMEGAGWLDAHWEEHAEAATANRPRRRLYRLSGKGLPLARAAMSDRQLRREKAIWNIRPQADPA